MAVLKTQKEREERRAKEEAERKQEKMVAKRKRRSEAKSKEDVKKSKRRSGKAERRGNKRRSRNAKVEEETVDYFIKSQNEKDVLMELSETLEISFRSDPVLAEPGYKIIVLLSSLLGLLTNKGVNKAPDSIGI